MRVETVSPWFAQYLDTFQRCARGELEASQLLAYYGAPLIVTTDDQSTVLADEAQVAQMATQQVEAVRAAGYHRSEVLDLEVVRVNATTDLYRGEFLRLREDGSEIARLGATYLAVGAIQGRRMAVLALHSA